MTSDGSHTKPSSVKPYHIIWSQRQLFNTISVRLGDYLGSVIKEHRAKFEMMMVDLLDALTRHKNSFSVNVLTLTEDFQFLQKCTSKSYMYLCLKTAHKK